MRRFAYVLFCGMAALSLAAEKSAEPKLGTDAKPFIVKVLPAKGTSADDRSADAAEKSADATVRAADATDRSTVAAEKFYSVNVVLTLITFALFIVSFFVALSGRKDARAALRLAKISADASAISASETKRSADTAFKASIPLLTPHVSAELTNLHPLSKTVIRDFSGPDYSEFDSTVFFTFSNFGKTPAIIREVRADLFLLLNDELPPSIDLDQLPQHDYSVIIPGEVKDGTGVTSFIDYKKNFHIAPHEMDELLKEANFPFRRLNLIGRVTYDDFFEHRHVRPFWVKFRLVPRPGGQTAGLFQAQKGGKRFSSVSIDAVPKSDPLS